jgi:hypothetical protein
MAKRIKAEDYKVSDPDTTMERFKALLGKLVQVPKHETKAKPKRKRVKPSPKRKA